MRTGVVIVAAGSAKRMKGKDKVFAVLRNKPLLAWSVDVCQGYQLIDEIVIVLRKEDLEKGRKLAIDRGWHKVTEVCCGGERRQDSVREGIKRLKKCDWVVIHDGARPFLNIDLLHDGFRAAEETGAAIAAVPVKDTVKVVKDMVVIRTLERRHLWAVQTPQVFHWNVINSAYERIVHEVTDDAALVEKIGCKVKIYVGDYSNIKITTPEDLIIAEAMAGGRL